MTDGLVWTLDAARKDDLDRRLRDFGSRSALMRVLIAPSHPPLAESTTRIVGGDGDVTKAAAVVVTTGPSALVLLAHNGAAWVVRELVRELRPGLVTGPAEDVEQVSAGLDIRTSHRMMLHTTPRMEGDWDADPRVRRATAEDIPRMQELLVLGGFGNDSLSDQAAQSLAHSVRLDLVRVAEEDGRVAGMVSSSGYNADWLVVDTLALDPAYRRRGLALSLGIAIAFRARDLGLSLVALHHTTNTMRLPDHELVDTSINTPWLVQHLNW